MKREERKREEKKDGDGWCERMRKGSDAGRLRVTRRGSGGGQERRNLVLHSGDKGEGRAAAYHNTSQGLFILIFFFSFSRLEECRSGRGDPKANSANYFRELEQV